MTKPSGSDPKRTLFSALLSIALIATACNKRESPKPRSEPAFRQDTSAAPTAEGESPRPDYSKLVEADIYRYADDTIAQAIDYRMDGMAGTIRVTSKHRNGCVDTLAWAIARDTAEGLGAESLEDEEGNGYFVEEYVHEQGGCWVSAKIAFEDGLAELQTLKCGKPGCGWAEDRLLKSAKRDSLKGSPPAGG